MLTDLVVTCPRGSQGHVGLKPHVSVESGDLVVTSKFKASTKELSFGRVPYHCPGHIDLGPGLYRANACGGMQTRRIWRTHAHVQSTLSDS